MWFSARRFVKLKLKLLSLQELIDIRRNLTAALILTTEETEKRYRSAIAHSTPIDEVDANREIEIACTNLAQRADRLHATASLLWEDFLWPESPPRAEAKLASCTDPPDDMSTSPVR